MPDIDELKRCRDDAQAQFATLGDLRPGKLHENYRKCGKPNCHCADDDSPGHGPSYVLNRSIRGRPRSVRIPPEEFERTRRLVEEHERFLDISARYLEASEALADAVRSQEGDGARAEKGGSSRRRSRRRSRRTSSA